MPDLVPQQTLRRPQLVHPPIAAEIVAEAAAKWRADLAAKAGESTLADTSLLGDAVIDLAVAHPSGVAQLFAGRPTLLTNLIREGATLPTARRRARAVAAKSADYAHRYGMAVTYLAIGVATWEQEVGDERSEEQVVVSASQPVELGEETPYTQALPLLTAHTAQLMTVPAMGDEAGNADASPDDAEPGEFSAELSSDERSEKHGSDTVSSSDVSAFAATDLDTDEINVAAKPRVRQVRTIRAPVLLRPIGFAALPGAEPDYELTLEPLAELNPVLVAALKSRGALLDPIALTDGTFGDDGFDPTSLLDRIGGLGASVLDAFQLDRRMLVAPFVHPGQALVRDLDELTPDLPAHPLVAALAGHQESRDLLLATAPNAEPELGDQDPETEAGVGDLDPRGRGAVAAAAKGEHLFVDAPVGSDAASVVASIVADAAAAGRQVLYVTGHRRSADALTAQLAALDLDGLLLDIPPTPNWRQTVASRLLSAMAAEAVPVDEAGLARLKTDLVAVRSELGRYIDALHQVRAPWNISPYSALQALASLTDAQPAPATKVCLPQQVLLAMTPQVRQHHAAALTRAGELGAFDESATTSPWNDAALFADDDATLALTRVRRLATTTLPQLAKMIAVVSEATGFKAAETVSQFGQQLQVLSGMRGSLDLFQPIVFERPVDDLVAATASHAWRAEHGVEMGLFTRRRLRKRAHELLRPGCRTPDLHGALLEVQEQRAIWARNSTTSSWPVLPTGFKAIEDTHSAVMIDLGGLEPVLRLTTIGGQLATLPMSQLVERLTELDACSADLESLPACNTALRESTAAGLGSFIDDLVARRVHPAMVTAELELAWWRSAFEQLLAADPALAGQDGSRLEALAAKFRELDTRFVAAKATPLRAAARAHLGVAMREDRAESESLFAELVEGRLTTVRELREEHPQVLPKLRPVWVATPTLVPHLLSTACEVDLVVIDAVQHVAIESLIPAIFRGRQVVVVGDPRSASGTAVTQLSRALPHVRLDTRLDARDSAVSELLAKHGYAGLFRSAPLPRGESRLELTVVDGTGMPDPRTGVVETTTQEVERVVEMAIEHALVCPEVTFAIVAGTTTHADRIREALLSQVRANPALAPCFSGKRSEPVVVADLTGTAALSRDTIILSLGLGRTPHGRVLHRFGPIGDDGGAQLLLGAIGAARRQLRMVASFGVDDLVPERVRGDGPTLLLELLTIGANRAPSEPEGTSTAPTSEPSSIGSSGPANRLIADIGERLWRLGYDVETNYGPVGGAVLPLVIGHPDLPGEMLVAVLTDDDEYIAEPSVRVRDRQRVERLEGLGWTVTHLWSAAAFLNPDGETERLRRLVQTVRDRRMGNYRSTLAPRVEVPDVIEDHQLEELPEVVDTAVSAEATLFDHAPASSDE